MLLNVKTICLTVSRANPSNRIHLQSSGTRLIKMMTYTSILCKGKTQDACDLNSSCNGVIEFIKSIHEGDDVHEQNNRSGALAR
jgi:hypothetical protein